MTLGRSVKKHGKQPTLISWSGTMFEYMMPWLIMRTYRDTIWDSTYKGVVARQIEYAKERGVPFGISESGFYAFDHALNYQYRAFGVPGLGFKRGLEDDVVISPYATIMALPYAAEEGMKDLQRMEELGARGQYGFYEAIDYTRSRMPDGDTCKVIRSFMAHHQGMSLLTLANLLAPRKMYDYFHKDKRVQAAELLLIERIPPRDALIAREISVAKRNEIPMPAQVAPLREFTTVSTPVQEVNVHSNGKLTSVVTNSGSGFIRYDGMDLSRWREDPVGDPWGSYMYIRDAGREKVWSPTYFPCRIEADHQLVQFSQERSTFIREEHAVASKLEIIAAADEQAEVRRLTLTNKSGSAITVEVTTFLELALSQHDADKAHPAFTRLFLQTEYDPAAECLLARKRPRQETDRSLWAFHKLFLLDSQAGGAEYETDRVRFIGRGHTIANPAGLETRLGGTVGSVADPAFVMRRRVSIEPGYEVQLVALTGAAQTRDEALEYVKRLSNSAQVEQAMRLAWTRSQIELHHLQITSADAAIYQQLASRVLYPTPLRTEQSDAIKVNSQGQQGLWAYGVSGDRPILIVRIADSSQMSFISKLLAGYAYLRRLRIDFDLVIWNESAGSYMQDLREALLRKTEQIIGGPDGVHILPASTLPEEAEALLFAVARYILRADGPSLKAQLKISEQETLYSEAITPAAMPNRFPEERLSELSEGQFFNGWGNFSPDGKEYQIMIQQQRHLPAPWINVMANPIFGTLVSELYTGYTWWRNSRECKLTPWSNDTALDPPGEVCYLRDEDSGEYWQMAPSRLAHAVDFKVTHGQGYSRYEQSSHSLDQEMTVFVPKQDPVKIIKLVLQNKASEARRLSITYYVEWVLGVHREGNASSIVTAFDEASGVLIAQNSYQENFREATAFLGIYPQSDAAISWTSDRAEFLGRNRMWESPDAMSRKDLSGTVGAVYDTCGAVQAHFDIGAGEERTIYMLLGCTDSHSAVTQLAQHYRNQQACDQAFVEVKDFWEDLLGTISVSTPSAEMNVMLNHWLLYQTLSCRLWARSAFYQAGGAFGYRDQLQDSMAMLHSMPELTRKQIILNASHQYVEGDVQHWWHEETERGIRTRFSDDLLWLPYAVLRYIEHSGDRSILDETAPFLTSDLLGPEEHERYEPTVHSGEVGTIYEHCVRALERSLRYGEHGLPLMGIGDWNDGMSLIGAQGRGESVWLGWFLGDILRGFAEVCELRSEPDRATRYRHEREKIAAAMNDAAWDGKWYRRAFTDSGQWLGSIRNEECRIDSIAQSWSVISGMAPPERAQQAMRSFDRELVNRELTLAHILTPPFDKTDPSPGYIQGYPPGIRENGGQYTHGVIWSIVAWCKLGEGDKAFELFQMFNPINHTRTAAGVRTYVGEPYAMAADVYSEEPHRGHAGWTWYTGASGWMYQAGIEWILGIRRQGDRLFIRPCIPSDWPEFAVSYRFESTKYHISVLNPSHKSEGDSKLMIDGQEIDLSESLYKDGPNVHLRDDLADHHIELTL